jgi:hypothetical protein
MGDLSALSNVNPLQKLLSMAFASAEGFRKGLSWLCLFASSGVDIPFTTFLDFATNIPRFQMELQDCALLIKACLYSCWLRSIGRQEMQAAVAMVLSNMEPQISQNLQSRHALTETLGFFSFSCC